MYMGIEHLYVEAIAAQFLRVLISNLSNKKKKH